jgi:predicted HTH domain antitoxin
MWLRDLRATVPISRAKALEALALEGYRCGSLTLCQISRMLGLSRVQTEDFLGQHQIPLCDLSEADLEREAAVLDNIDTTGFKCLLFEAAESKAGTWIVLEPTHYFRAARFFLGNFSKTKS